MNENLKTLQQKLVTEIINEIKLEQYDFRNHMLNSSYDNPLSLYLSSQIPLSEGLIMTHKPDIVKQHLCNYLGADPSWCHITTNNNVEMIVLDIPDVGDNINIIDKALDFYGYFKSKTGNLIWKPGFLRLHYEPKNQEETTKQMNLLYHITPEKHVQKIQKIGLCPKHKNKYFYYPARIYLFSDDAPMNYIEGLKAMFSNLNNNDKYVTLTIDRRLLGDNIILHEDPNCEHGYWTEDNIHPDAIINIS